MIEYEESAGAVVRCVESDVAGRRVAAYATPCSGEVGGPAFRFDPLERRLVARRPSGRVSVGSWDPDAWARAFSRCPPGPVLVGPGSPVDEIRGSCQAAAEGAFRSGRGVYLCDPEPSGLPEAARGALVALCIWAPGDEDWERRLASPLAHGIPSGAVLPVLPGWTDEREFLGEWFTRVISAGAQFTAALAASGGGDERRLLVEARARVDPGSADRFFEKIHHCDWTAAVREGLARFRAEAARRGLSTIPPRPMGPAEPPGNSAAAARLEEQAVEVEEDEHRSSLLLAAARWIDESGRDLTPVVREGNFAKVFPFGALAREAEAAFRVERS